MGFKSRAQRNAEEKLGGRPRRSENTLSAWVDKHCIDPKGLLTARAVFAKELGISISSLHQLCRGEFSPSMTLAARIELHTHGGVPVAVWADALSAAT